MVTRRAAVGVLLLAALAGCGTESSAEHRPATTASVRRTTARAGLARRSTTTARRRPPTTPAPPTTEALAKALRLGEGGLGRARFGDDPAKVVAYVRAVIGRYDDDSGWMPVTGDGCGGRKARSVRWGRLVVFFGDGAPYGRPGFVGWRYGPLVDDLALQPDGLRTSTTVGIGTTAARLHAQFPAALRVGAGRPAPFAVGTSFRGLLDRPTGTVVQLEAGAACAA
jgi:hypothetical protein